MISKKLSVSTILIICLISFASCRKQAQNHSDNSRAVSSAITWIEDKPGPIFNDFGLFPEVPDSVWAVPGLEEGIPASISCFLLQTEGKNILFDAGLGAPFSGLLVNLARMGLTGEDINQVYITHLHGDHIGGMMKDDKKVFSNAEVYINRAEAEYWLLMSNDKGKQAADMMEAYKDRLHFFEAGDTLDCGIISIAAYGHTPGHTVFRKDSILIVGDIMHGLALQEKYPEYCARYDMDKEASVEARKRIMDYAAANGLTMYGMHFPPKK